MFIDKHACAPTHVCVYTYSQAAVVKINAVNKLYSVHLHGCKFLKEPFTEIACEDESSEAF